MRGYPKFRAEIIDQSQIQDIEVKTLSGRKPLMMQVYTSDRGTEDWEVINTFNNFTDIKGPISFLRHGQAQLTVAEILRAGGSVLAKRLVSDDATFANVTIRARIVETTDGKLYIYYYKTYTSVPTVNEEMNGEIGDTLKVNSTKFLYKYIEEDIKDLEVSPGVGSRGYIDEDENTVIEDYSTEAKRANAIPLKSDKVAIKAKIKDYYDMPIFTFTPIGRGESTIDISISPNYILGRNNNTFYYTFKIFDIITGNTLESITFSMNLNAVVDNESQTINPKININSKIINVKMYETNVGYMISKCIDFINKKYNSNPGVTMNIPDSSNIINIDYLNGKIINGSPVSMYEIKRITSSSDSSKTIDTKVLKPIIISANNMESDVVLTQTVTDDETGVTETVDTDNLTWERLLKAFSDYSVPSEPDASKAYLSRDTTSFDGSLIDLKYGSFGTMGSAPIKNKTEYNKMAREAFGDVESYVNLNTTNDAGVYMDEDEKFEIAIKSGLTPINFDPIIYDLDMYKPDAIFDCGFDFKTKKAICALADFRGDLVFFADLGTGNLIYAENNIGEKFCYLDTSAGIIRASKCVNDGAGSRNLFITHNYFDIYDPYTKRQITVTLPFLLAPKMVAHIKSGVSKPFAGIANNMTFPDIIDGTINYIPYNLPGHDYKQLLANECINYISYYDGVPVLETEYSYNEEYSELSFINNVMNIQQIVKRLRSECPSKRYTFVDGEDLSRYIDDCQSILNEYTSQFRSIELTYMADEAYERNKIFYAVLKVSFKGFFQEEYFKIIAIN